MKQILNKFVRRRNSRVTMAALSAELRRLRKEMAALRRQMPPAPYLDLDLDFDSEWRGDSNDSAA